MAMNASAIADAMRLMLIVTQGRGAHARPFGQLLHLDSMHAVHTRRLLSGHLDQQGVALPEAPSRSL
jgi:hypothetical protein